MQKSNIDTNNYHFFKWVTFSKPSFWGPPAVSFREQIRGANQRTQCKTWAWLRHAIINVNVCEHVFESWELEDMLNVFQGRLKYINACMIWCILCRIIKAPCVHHKSSPLSSYTIPKRGKTKIFHPTKSNDDASSPQSSSNLRKMAPKTGQSCHSFILIIPNSICFFPFFFASLPPGVSCLHVSKWPSRPRRVRPVRARRWTPGGRAAASGGNPSPTFVVDLTRLRWGESWMSRTGSERINGDRINGLFHLPWN